MRILYRRIIDTMVENIPAPNMAMRAIFSWVGRLTDASVLMGNTRIHISVTMLKIEVAGNGLAPGTFVDSYDGRGFR